GLGEQPTGGGFVAALSEQWQARRENQGKESESAEHAAHQNVGVALSVIGPGSIRLEQPRALEASHRSSLSTVPAQRPRASKTRWPFSRTASETRRVSSGYRNSKSWEPITSSRENGVTSPGIPLIETVQLPGWAATFTETVRGRA